LTALVRFARSGRLREAWGGRRWSSVDTEGFRDRAEEGLDRAEEEADERTGGRFDEQTDRAADEARERGGSMFGDQEGESQEDESQP
jgi:hypothetical protein